MTSTEAAKVEAIKTAAPLYSSDNWKRRRKVVFLTLAFLAVCIAWLVFFAPSDSLRESLSIPLLTAFVSIVGSYVFGAIWDDNNKRNNIMGAVAGKPGPSE